MKISVFSRPEMYTMDRREPPGLWKGELVTNTVMSGAVIRQDFRKVTEEQLKKVHDPDYVDAVLSCQKGNGYSTRNPDHLENILWSNGSFIAAAHHAMRKGIAFSPTAGFHHACYKRGGGYCTFNGLLVAVATLPPGTTVLILDGDQHLGDGVEDILQHEKTAGQFANVGYLSVAHYDTTARFTELAKDLIHAGNFDLVMYQAGADCHQDDILGGGIWSTREMAIRDAVIFDEAARTGTPIVWNLAGGYGAPSMKNTCMLHYNTWQAANESQQYRLSSNQDASKFQGHGQKVFLQ